jgi:hypothetical protein
MMMKRQACLLLATALATGPTAAGTLAALDFNAGNPWPALTARSSGSATTARADWAASGTIDDAGSDKASGAMQLSVSAGAGPWQAHLVSGPIAVRNQQPDLARLTLGLMLSTSAARPVTVRVESLNAKGQPSGAMEGRIHPAAPDFYQRYSLDLGTLKPVGAGRFKPLDAAIRVSLSISQADGWGAGAHSLSLDNLSYASPAYYVSPQGSDSNDGRSERTAFATPQRALDLAGPGDIVLLAGGTYHGGARPAARFVSAGTPAAWIVLKNAPGQRPTLRSNAWNIVDIRRGSKEAPSDLPALAYLEIRGLHVRGDADTVEQDYPELLNKPDPRVNTNGIAIDGRYDKHPPHHIRMADNLVEFAPGQGLGMLEADWVTIERNVSRYNCRTVIYATSGISTLGAYNFDGRVGNYKLLVRDNISHGNETRYKWAAIDKYSDGNGIIIDTNQSPAHRKGVNYAGRTLVVGNLVFNNGGSGIHTVEAAHVDIINNTAYLNSASRNLEYGQIFASWKSRDVRILNNILVAPVADVQAGAPPEPVNPSPGEPTDVVYRNNLYFGGNLPPTLGEGDRIADPLFVNPTRVGAQADFRLREGSPARSAGAVAHPALPLLDLHGRARPAAAGFDLGAYQAMAVKP